MRTRIVLGCTASYWALLFLATHWPSSHLPWSNLPWDLPSDVVLHFVAFAILTLLLVFAVAERVDSWSSASLCLRCVAIVMVVAMYGILDEATQPLIGRDFKWLEWAADVAGAVAGVVLGSGFILARRARVARGT